MLAWHPARSRGFPSPVNWATKYTCQRLTHDHYDQIVKAGARLGIRAFGIRALVSLGMEKSFGVWSREFTPDYTPAMCGFDRFVDYYKTNFVGRRVALIDHETTPGQKLVALEIDSDDADTWGYEPIWFQDELAGFVTSGTYGHTVNKSLAMAYVKTHRRAT